MNEYNPKILKCMLIVSLCFGSCGYDKPVSDNVGSSSEITEITELNDWQKNVLEKMKLPTEVNELSDSQRYNIQRIYEMKSYLDEKYGTEFEYVGYIAGSYMESEQFLAYPKEMGMEYGKNLVTVQTEKDGSFTDNYSSFELRDYCESLLEDYLEQYFEPEEYRSYPTVNACHIEKSEIINNDFQWKYGVSNTIFIREDKYNLEQIESFASHFANWLYEHKIDGGNRINIMLDIPEDINWGDCHELYYSDEYKGYYNFSIDYEDNVVRVDYYIKENKIRKMEEYSIEEFLNIKS